MNKHIIMKEPYILVHQLGILPDMEKGARLAESIVLKKGIVPVEAALFNDIGRQGLRDFLWNFRVHCNES
jgi:hypothetical protein